MIAYIISLLLALTTIGAANGIDRTLLQQFGDFSIGGGIPDALFSLQQDAQDGSAVSENSDANAGNTVQAEMIRDIYPEDSMGVGIGQFAVDNSAESQQGDGQANSGNQIGVDLGIADSSFEADQIAAENFAQADDGDANSGNQNLIGDITDSNIDIDSAALYNTATTDSGLANSGNQNQIGDISGSEFNLDDVAIGNVATSNDGDTNAGNVAIFGNLSGWKLQKFPTTLWKKY